MHANRESKDTITALLPAAERVVDGIARRLPAFISRDDLHGEARLAIVRTVLAGADAGVDLERRVAPVL